MYLIIIIKKHNENTKIFLKDTLVNFAFTLQSLYCFKKSKMTKKPMDATLNLFIFKKN
jgi:hypothetical protein